MNRIAEKIVPVMNETELRSLIVSSYQQDAQTLSRDGESNILKFKELLGILSKEEQDRWDAIRYTFSERNRLKGLTGDDSTTQVLGSLLGLRDGLESIRRALADAVTAATQSRSDDLKKLAEEKPSPLPDQTSDRSAFGTAGNDGVNSKPVSASVRWLKTRTGTEFQANADK